MSFWIFLVPCFLIINSELISVWFYLLDFHGLLFFDTFFYIFLFLWYLYFLLKILLIAWILICNIWCSNFQIFFSFLYRFMNFFLSPYFFFLLWVGSTWYFHFFSIQISLLACYQSVFFQWTFNNVPSIDIVGNFYELYLKVQSESVCIVKVWPYVTFKWVQ